MLVKQVFSRFMGVWIFAVALLVGEVFCEKVDLEYVIDMYVGIKIWSMRFSAYRIELMRRNFKCEYKKQEDMKPISEILLEIKEIDDKINSDVKNGGFANLYNLDLEYNPLTYEWANKIRFMGKALPHPFQANLVRLVRVQTFGRSLQRVLAGLKPYWEGAHSEFTEPNISEMISLLGKLPVLEKYERHAFLEPKQTIGVSWQDVTYLHSAMVEKLKGYVPAKDDIKNDAVLVNFLQLKDGMINCSIIDAVNSLFDKSLVFRLAVSEFHTVFISDNPKALLYTRFLQETLRKLYRFVNWLATEWALKPIVGSERKAYKEDMDSHLKGLDYSNEYLEPSVVYDLKQILEHGPGGNILPDNAIQDLRISLFPKVFAEFEAMSRFFRTFAPFKERVMSGKKRSESDIDDSKHRSNLKLLVAFTDERFEALIEFFNSSEVAQTCEGGPIPATWGFGVKTTLIELCVLRSRAVLHGPLHTDTSLFHMLMITYPGFGFSKKTNLDLLPPSIILDKLLVGWENWLKKGLDELNLLISAHKFNIA